MTDLEIKEMMAAIGKKAKVASAELAYATAESKQKALIFAAEAIVIRMDDIIVANKLDLDYGGGLCQLSGILYYLVLGAGLKILERHPHSLDIYTETTRYTPIGSDATVVYGHKDLRFINSFDFPISFQFEVLEKKILIYLCAEKEIKKCDLEFLEEKKDFGKYVEVIRQRNGKKEICSQNFYKNL